MNIKPALAIVLLATHLAVPVSSVLARTAGDVLESYEALKKPERKMRLIEEAKKEGRLVFYGTLGVDASRPMLDRFRQSHSYISIDHYRSGSVGIYNRVVNEARAGKHESISSSSQQVPSRISFAVVLSIPIVRRKRMRSVKNSSILDIFGTRTTIWL
jgi:hypothetical protein